MLRANPTSDRRNAAQPRWGWSGGGVLSPLREHSERIRSIVSSMPLRVSMQNESVRRQEMVEELLQLGARYQRYLHQDELGPVRAQRLAALRQVSQQLLKLIGAIERL